MKDYLIIGHGLAGALLSQSLLDKNLQITVLDTPQSNHSSTVAAGLYNPVTGRKMVKTWMADEHFPVIEPFYRALEIKLGSRFLYDIGIYRPFVSFEEQNDWDAQQSDSKYRPFISSIHKESHQAVQLQDPYGGIHLQPAGYIRIPQLLADSRDYLITRNCYREEKFDEGQLTIEPDHVQYGKESYRQLIYCNGVSALESKLFGWIPLRPVKGEIIRAEMHKKIDTIYNRGVFVIPIGNHQVRIGSNYQNHFDDLSPTEAAQTEITKKLNNLLHEPTKVIDIVAGVRPATKDRRPIIGKHPEYEHIYVFNGFGSKGVSLIPYFTSRFIAFVEDQQPMSQDVDVSRFYSLYSS
ncbi:hypothetical protein BFP72_16185 [Reichenbachiella sp. 5M10]|uniref:NAD(P)/FAD-dependent oxidoreductase n=1 Tax=Reichenbachiella sp. 5M10 TaxID=1889772 RepID=UPI000C42F67F|nr:FAD-dependent oxidoreductase [Reichenbachiella sp. 5M10]PIB36829.1 hypothetical protein BFP72_16185 [Reichenbachiella sp. 5M10]